MGLWNIHDFEEQGNLLGKMDSKQNAWLDNNPSRARHNIHRQRYSRQEVGFRYDGCK